MTNRKMFHVEHVTHLFLILGKVRGGFSIGTGVFAPRAKRLIALREKRSGGAIHLRLPVCPQGFGRER